MYSISFEPLEVLKGLNLNLSIIMLLSIKIAPIIRIQNSGMHSHDIS